MVVAQFVFEGIVANVPFDGVDEGAGRAEPVVVALLPEGAVASVLPGQPGGVAFETAEKRAQHFKGFFQAGLQMHVAMQVVRHDHPAEERDLRDSGGHGLQRLCHDRAERGVFNGGVHNPTEERGARFRDDGDEERSAACVVVVPVPAEIGHGGLHEVGVYPPRRAGIKTESGES